MSENIIRVVGARVHNLKNLTVEIPRDKFVVITGLSGSGKSSLAFDTIFAEGQRRYVESLSAYARQFLGQMNKPDVDYIEGLSPAVSIDQRGASHNPRSTVGTVTEIYDYLRLLFARVGTPHCPICGKEVVQQSAQEIVDAVEKLPAESRLLILAPLIRGRKGTHQTVLDEMRKSGFLRVRIDAQIYDLEEEIQLDRYKIHMIEAVIDRLVLRNEKNEEEQQAFRSRLTDSIETALRLGDGYLTIHNLSADPPEDILFSEHLTCPEHGISLPEIEPRTFSFNTPHGACTECQGIGYKLEIDPDMLIPDRSKSLNKGAINASFFSFCFRNSARPVTAPIVAATEPARKWRRDKPRGRVFVSEEIDLRKSVMLFALREVALGDRFDPRNLRDEQVERRLGNRGMRRIFRRRTSGKRRHRRIADHEDVEIVFQIFVTGGRRTDAHVGRVTAQQNMPNSLGF